MPKPIFTEQFLVTVTSDKPIKDLYDTVAGRLWSLDHVTDVTAAKFEREPLCDYTVVEIPRESKPVSAVLNLPSSFYPPL